MFGQQSGHIFEERHHELRRVVARITTGKEDRVQPRAIAIEFLVLGQYCDAGTVSLNPHNITRKQLQIFGSWSSEPRHLKAALDFLRATPKQFPFAEMVSHRFTLDQANEALATTARWESAKSVLLPA